MKEIDPEYVNQIIPCDCVEGMRHLACACIPLTVTSPPYDDLRKYGGHCFEFEAVANELYRITIPGGVVVWVIQNEITDEGESATSFRQCFYFLELGFRLHCTIIMARAGTLSPGNVRYGPSPEYTFVLSKGRPRTVNILKDRPNKHAGVMRTHFTRRSKDGVLYRAGGARTTPAWGKRSAIWCYATGRYSAKEEFVRRGHPALMPEAMAQDLIISWSQPGDLVFDPMCGAGTTCKMALLNNRSYLGMEVVQRYCEIARERVRLAQQKALDKDGLITQTFE
jgi:hypothetical protein